MLINYCGSQIFIVVNLLFAQHVGRLSSSLAFVEVLSPFIILVTLWKRDFWLAFGPKLSALRKRLSLVSIFNSQHMVELIPALPQSDEEPSFAEMATWLIKALPASDRPEAYTLLVTQLLPKGLQRLPPFMERRWYVESLYESLSDVLQQARPNQRLQVLRAELCLSEIRRLSSESVILAIARYMQEHPDATPDGPMYWLDFDEISKWSAMPKAELQNEASKRLKELERWDLFAKANHPSVWEQYCIRYIHIQINLGCAYSGIFPTAMGELALFLDAVGASFNEIHLH